MAWADTNHSTARNSKPIEVLGTYDPIPKAPLYGDGKPIKDIKLDTIRAKYWLGVGAQPSDPVWRMLSMVYHHERGTPIGPFILYPPWRWQDWLHALPLRPCGG